MASERNANHGVVNIAATKKKNVMIVVNVDEHGGVNVVNVVGIVIFFFHDDDLEDVVIK